MTCSLRITFPYVAYKLHIFLNIYYIKMLCNSIWWNDLFFDVFLKISFKGWIICVILIWISFRITKLFNWVFPRTKKAMNIFVYMYVRDELNLFIVIYLCLLMQFKRTHTFWQKSESYFAPRWCSRPLKVTTNRYHSCSFHNVPAKSQVPQKFQVRENLKRKTNKQTIFPTAGI